MKEKTNKEARRIRQLYSNGEITLNRARELLSLAPIYGGDIKINPISKNKK